MPSQTHLIFSRGKIMKPPKEVPEASPLTDTARSRRYSAVVQGVSCRVVKVFQRDMCVRRYV